MSAGQADTGVAQFLEGVLLVATNPHFLTLLVGGWLLIAGGVYWLLKNQIENHKSAVDGARAETANAKQESANAAKVAELQRSKAEFFELQLKQLKESEDNRIRQLPTQELRDKEVAQLIQHSDAMLGVLKTAIEGRSVYLTLDPNNPAQWHQPVLTPQINVLAAIANTTASGVVNTISTGPDQFQATPTDTGRRVYRMIAETGHFNVAGHDAQLTQRGTDGLPKPTMIGEVINYGPTGVDRSAYSAGNPGSHKPGNPRD